MEIKPRRISDRGGIIAMPLKANVPDPNDKFVGGNKLPRMWRLYVGNALSQRIQRRYV